MYSKYEYIFFIYVYARNYFVKCLYPLNVSIALMRRCFVASLLLLGVSSSSAFIIYCVFTLYHKDLPADMASKINIIIAKIINNSVNNKKRERKKNDTLWYALRIIYMRLCTYTNLLYIKKLHLLFYLLSQYLAGIK